MHLTLTTLVFTCHDSEEMKNLVTALFWFIQNRMKAVDTSILLGQVIYNGLVFWATTTIIEPWQGKAAHNILYRVHYIVNEQMYKLNIHMVV
jgi:hypothetical protein